MEKKSEVINSLFYQKNLDKLSTQFYYLRHVKQDEKYRSVEIDVSNDLVNWLKGDIKKNLENYWDSENKKFNLVVYNHELSLMDSIAELDLSLINYESVQKSKKEMINATTNNDKEVDQLKKSNFCLVKFYTSDDCVYFGYYRGIKKSGSRKKVAIFEKNEFTENEHTMIELGGSISFLIHKETVYIIQPRNFEFAFKYSDHITKMRNENIDNLVKLSIFPDEESKEIFRNKASNHLYSRSLANMDNVTFQEIEKYYNDRCLELKGISDKIEANPDIKENLVKQKGILIDLIDYIDFEHGNMLKITEKSDIKPLLHLFQDKIVEKYMSKRIDLMPG